MSEPDLVDRAPKDARLVDPGQDGHEPATRVTPALPGYLSLREIAALAAIAVGTLRSYRRDSSTGFPAPAWRAGSTPLWRVEDVREWLAARPFSPTMTRAMPDGSIEVARASDYVARRAAGRVGRARRRHLSEPHVRGALAALEAGD
ncbi:helix-turn-helix transcriptional regulator [Occultella gossypii]|uniref:AlpA family phage regulatory protein n=1 Tax=Occultella gossypii TaxID=2800820 RepID=A0ABS7S9Q4_9MICO|nr:hypothetical protein [Occultella gossypii]MBZ2196842.1 hypothetical protein [Occultella gossypii]